MEIEKVIEGIFVKYNWIDKKSKHAKNSQIYEIVK